MFRCACVCLCLVVMQNVNKNNMSTGRTNDHRSRWYDERLFYLRAVYYVIVFINNTELLLLRLCACACLHLSPKYWFVG